MVCSLVHYIASRILTLNTLGSVHARPPTLATTIFLVDHYHPHCYETFLPSQHVSIFPSYDPVSPDYASRRGCSNDVFSDISLAGSGWN